VKVDLSTSLLGNEVRLQRGGAAFQLLGISQAQGGRCSNKMYGFIQGLFIQYHANKLGSCV